MTNYLEYTDQKLINILQRLNEDLEKEKYLEEPVPPMATGGNSVAQPILYQVES